MSAYSPKAGEHFHLTREQSLLVGAQRIPVLDRLGLRREFRIGRHDAKLLLALQRLLTQFIPALVELALVFGDPLLRDVVRRMGRARREIHEEWLVRRQRLLRLDPLDRLVGHVGHEVIARLFLDLDLRHSVPNGRGPLIGLAADEAIELVETRARRPAICRARGAELPHRRLMRLAERGGRIAVQAKHLGERGDAVRPHACVPLEGGRRLGDRAHVVDVVVAAGEQGRAGRRA